MHLNFWVTIQFPVAYQSKRLVIFPELRWSCGRIIILVWGTILVFKEMEYSILELLGSSVHFCVPESRHIH